MPYAELHCKSNFSFLEGASHPEELVERAAALGHHALAITDRNSLAGVVRAHVAARDAGFKLLIGTEITPQDAPPLLVFPTDRAAYGRLTRLLTIGKRRAPKGECFLTIEDVAQHATGLIACPLLNQIRSTESLANYRDIFSDRCYGIAELHLGPNDAMELERMVQLSQQVKVPIAAANDVHYHIPKRRFLHDVVTAIRHRSTVAELGAHRFPNGERYLKSLAQMEQLFAEVPGAVERTCEIAERCQFSLDELRYDYPEELCPSGKTLIEHLKELTWGGAAIRYPGGVPGKVRDILEHEFQLIQKLHYESYFLTVWDLVRFARSQGILCQGRGSAANSAVCYCLGVTSVDPEQIDVLFERFVSEERNEAPDIDVDFEHERREEVLQYIYEKYGRDRAGMTATVITYRPKSAIRDVGKALGLSLDRVDTLAKSASHLLDPKEFERCFNDAGLDPKSRLCQQYRSLLGEILGFPRHLSQHVGGMVITNRPLCEMAPIENAAMEGRTIIPWDKDDLDSLGILKVDCLCLGMLSAVRKCFEMVELHYDRQLELATIPQDDPAVYQMISKADTLGVFQIESRAQMSSLPLHRPEKFYDLVIQVAIIRPGPIQGDMVHPYRRRRNGEEPVEYPDERIRSVLHKTLGVPLFQEQAMRLAIVAAGFTPGEADQLRRAMAAWRRSGNIDQFRDKLVRGMKANGYNSEFGERLFKMIRGFGEYGFPESHAASFARIAYASAWLKYYYQAAFTASILNSLPMGFYGPAQLIRDARNHGIEVRPVDINHSQWSTLLEPQLPDAPHSERTIRLGFRLVKGISEQEANHIVTSRGVRPFASFDDFARRTKLSSATLQKLARADVFGSIDIDRRTATWDALEDQRQLHLFEAAPAADQVSPDLPPMTAYEEVASDYQVLGLSLRKHPMAFLRQRLQDEGVLCSEDLATGPTDRWVKVAGLVILRQRPSTAKGVTFMTLEDEFGHINLVVRPDIWEQFRKAAGGATILLATGPIQRASPGMTQTDAEVIHHVAFKLEDISPELRDVTAKSRDFH